MFYISLPETLMPQGVLAMTDQCARLRDAALDISLHGDPLESSSDFIATFGWFRADYSTVKAGDGDVEHDLVLRIIGNNVYSPNAPKPLHLRWSEERFEIVKYEAGSWEDELLTLAESYGYRCYHCGEISH